MTVSGPHRIAFDVTSAGQVARICLEPWARQAPAAAQMADCGWEALDEQAAKLGAPLRELVVLKPDDEDRAAEGMEVSIRSRMPQMNAAGKLRFSPTAR